MNPKSLHERLKCDEFEEIPSGYRWPGNRLSYLDTRRLIYISNKTRKPINQIIKEAVVEYTAVMIARIEEEEAEKSPPE